MPTTSPGPFSLRRHKPAELHIQPERGQPDSADPFPSPKEFMTHPHAALVTRHRLKVARLVIDDGWPISEVDARFQVSWPTVKSWVLRYRVGQSMQDRSSRPHHSPNKTSAKTGRRCIALRLRLHEGPVQLAFRLGIASSTVHRIPTSVHLNRLSHVDRATGEPIRRYEHDHPGSKIHVDVKKNSASHEIDIAAHFWAAPTPAALPLRLSAVESYMAG